MRKLTALLAFLAFAPLLPKNYAQIGVVADKAYVLDTLRPNSCSAGLSFLFYLSDDEMKDYTAFRFLNSAHFTYVFQKTDLELSLRQTVERKDNGRWRSNDLLLLSSGIFKYRPIDSDRVVLRNYYLEPIAVYQDNTDRGLRRRFQVGALFHPWGYFRPRFNLNIGVGVVHDWSSWEVNAPKEIEAASPELREKIEFVNSRIRLRKGMYQDNAEWRPMVLLTLNYKMNNVVDFTLNTSYQQSLVSPYSKEIQDAYPDLGKIHPYILTQFDMHVKLHKGFGMSISTTVDYENNNLSLYKSSWGYSMLVGFSWVFSNQKPHSAR